MIRSLSLLLPVHNAQGQLQSTVATLLDVLPELTPDFEVFIVDDGSTDDTSDAAQHLAAQFPQVFLVRRPRRMGGEAALRPLLGIARGDVIFIRDEQSALDLHDIAKLWQPMKRRHYVQALPIGALADAGVRGVPRPAGRAVWERAVAPPQRNVATVAEGPTTPGFKMLLRSLAAEIPWSIRDPQALLAELVARGYDCEQVWLRADNQAPPATVKREVRTAPPSQAEQEKLCGLRLRPAPPVATPVPPVGVGAPQPAVRSANGARRPNYLARILAITAGN